MEQIDGTAILVSVLTNMCTNGQEIGTRMAVRMKAFNRRKEIVCFAETVDASYGVFILLVYGSKVCTIRQRNRNMSEELEIWMWRQMGGNKAVSYTHLDVYKRQVYISLQ